MLQNIFEILIILGGIGFLIWAWRSVARQGNQRDVSSLIGNALMKPFGGKADRR